MGSWMQISGRLFNKGDGTYSCRSYPVYKPIEAPHIPTDAFESAVTNNQLMLLPIHDPHWEDLPWSGGPVAWALLIIFASFIMAVVGGIFFSWFYAWRASKAKSTATSATIHSGSNSSSNTTSEEKATKDEQEQEE